MLNGHRVGALLLMGGTGKRFGSNTPKQFHRLSGKPIYQVTLEAFLATGFFDEIVLSCHPDWIDVIDPHPLVTIVPAGNTRQESSHLGLLGFRTAPDVVLIHDAVRPFVTTEILRENALLAIEHGAVDTCIPSTDTLVHAPTKESIDSIPNRADYLRGQTPQSFSYPLILEAHKKARGQDASDDCRLVLEMGHKIWIAKGDEYNVKITSELDLFLAEQLFRLRRNTPTGNESIAGKTYAIVGGSGGIGQEICKEIERQGAHAVPLSRRNGLDLRNSASIETSFAKLGPIDGLINCAGSLLVRPVSLLTFDEISEMLDVNLKGLILCCKTAHLKEGAHIINIASSSFARGRKETSIYSSAKAAVVNFTQALTEERPDLKIHAVIPQRTNTKMRQDNFPGEQSSELLNPAEVAISVVNVLKDPTSTGMLIEVKLTR